MRRWLKRIAITCSVLLALGLLIAAVVAWRVTRVPAWYSTAVDQTPADGDVATAAEAVIRQKLVPLQNWLARTSAGDLDAKPAAEKIYALELSEAEINTLLSRFLDNQHGDFETFRTRLTPGLAELGFVWAGQGRTLTIGMAIGKTPAGEPAMSLNGVRLGNQGIPLGPIRGPLASQVRSLLQSGNTRTPKIDENDGARSYVVEQYTGRVLLQLLSGGAVSPNAFLPVRVSDDVWVVTRVTRLEVTDGKMNVTFRLLDADEREALIDELTGPLP
ncbi:MAG: hypothetical protein QM754_04055 [Tepidisphaeraceae bacterium]